ncbi:hypothetical protein A1O1_08244 [Capronia coronata CBS 617.96]|uniref:Fumarylacetoacetase-like C-terminal domain-containing protein n=1 Tax=Capronia coronata CBS 617.96 TaxID=1182541 RepID=W9XXS9_9EURO|nr:uncharacterized protein A1O1_08244 [Capronia coronata CBS 617.96]EXJ82175.1 hypothetical protein A1O1_08244 [Capronia coronata CBS 617.96]
MPTNKRVWARFVSFVSDDGKIYAGEPVDAEIDVGLAVKEGKVVKARVLSSSSALDEGAKFTGQERPVKQILAVTAEQVGSIRCIGVNYNDHGAELGYAVPPVPIVFIKPNSALNDPSAPIIIPNFVADADFEVELCVVIGKEARNVTDDEALDYILGYSTSNDVAARRAQTITTQFCHGKGFDTFAPVGPTLVHAKAIPNPQILEMRTTLNGEEMQHTTLDTMIFPVARIVSHLSQATTIPAGTIIMTGTPGGIGHSRTPPQYLKEGDDLRLWISGGLGTLTNPIVKDKSSSRFDNGLAERNGKAL